MATNNCVNVGLAGAIGTVKFAGTTSPTFITPVLGAATATSVAFSPTTGGIVGTTAADAASAGTVGEVISSAIVVASAVTISTTVAKDVTSISLTAGDWDVWGNVYATGTTVTKFQCWTSQTSATAPDLSLVTFVMPLATSAAVGFPTPLARYNVSGATTVYLSTNCTLTGTGKASGNLYARRRR